MGLTLEQAESMRPTRRALAAYVLSSFKDEEARRQRALRWYDNLKKCSCSLCGNPRKIENCLPPQEQRLEEATGCEAEQHLTTDSGSHR
jgi:hypothetical protein